MKCLLIIDVQNGFISSETEYILPRLEKLINEFNGMVISTQFVNKGGPFNNILNWNKLTNPPEIDIVPFVKSASKYIIQKSVYTSCNYDLINLLRTLKVSEVYIVGIDTDCCVLKTAMDLFEINIRPIVLSYYCASNGGKKSHDAALTVLRRNIGDNQVVDGEFTPYNK